jgi:cytochrome b subunit of formate dehydrogenase
MSTPAAISPTLETAEQPRHYTRFSPQQRLLHAILLTTFLFLAATGLPLRFSSAAWSVAFAKALGGFAVIIVIHKLNAVILSAAFLYHVFDILYRVLVNRQWGLLWGRNSMTPNLKDLQDLIGQMKYFLFLGKKPQFDRFTYWEKLDYWGVFWGMAIIGISGYAMWFAPAFARLLPGRWLNVALLLHGEEALLATGYIFLIHFFNEHLRPGKFPMDITVFTGSHTEEEFQAEHPEEYARAMESGDLENMRTQAPPAWAPPVARTFGGLAVVVGIVLIALTAEAFLRQ